MRKNKKIKVSVFSRNQFFKSVVPKKVLNQMERKTTEKIQSQ